MLLLLPQQVFSTQDDTTSRAVNITESSEFAFIDNLVLESASDFSAHSGMAALYDVRNKELVTVVRCSDGSCDHSPDSVLERWEPGSVLKPILVAAAYDEGLINEDTLFRDEGIQRVDNRSIVNVSENHYLEYDVRKFLGASRNTGAVEIYKKFGEGQGEEDRKILWKQSAERLIPDLYMPPLSIGESNYRYALSSFGIWVTTTPIGLIESYASLVNGGSLCTRSIDGPLCAPTLQEDTAQYVKSLLSEVAYDFHEIENFEACEIGGKSGTAPVAQEGAVYRFGVDYGTYVGFVESSNSSEQDFQYILFTRLENPDVQIASSATRALWTNVVEHLCAN